MKTIAKTIASAVALATSLVLTSQAAHADMVDPALPEYKAASGISGNLKSIGSDSLNNLMTLWAEASTASIPTSRSRSKVRAPAPPRRR